MTALELSAFVGFVVMLAVACWWTSRVPAMPPEHDACQHCRGTLKHHPSCPTLGDWAWPKRTPATPPTPRGTTSSRDRSR